MLIFVLGARHLISPEVAGRDVIFSFSCMYRHAGELVGAYANARRAALQARKQALAAGL
jgi:hypothetical protein